MPDPVTPVNFTPGNSTEAVQDAFLNRGVGNDTAASSGPYYGCFLGLYTNAVSPSPELTLSDLDVPTFTGYALSTAVTWTPAVDDIDGDPYALGTLKTFASSDTVTVTVAGCFAVGSDSTTLKGVYNFPQPIPIVSGMPLNVVPMVSLEDLLS